MQPPQRSRPFPADMQVKSTTLWMTNLHPLPPWFGIWPQQLALHNRELSLEGSSEWSPRMQRHHGWGQGCEFTMRRPSANFSGDRVSPIIERESPSFLVRTNRSIERV